MVVKLKTMNSNLYERLQGLETFGIKFGLENIRRILEALQNPERAYPSILIAGTNGKGSVGAMMEASLVQNGYRTGYYVSPHLVHVRERIRIDGSSIDEATFLESLNRVFQVIDELQVPATHFETLTATGLLLFAMQKVDCAVLEVGMGGRFDATNVVHQKLSVITSIGFDHEAFLGSTIESIATEKAMITKPEVPMVIGNLSPKAKAVVGEVCKQTNSEVYPIDLANLANPALDQGCPTFWYIPWNTQVRLNLRGRHQMENAAVALLAVEKLHECGWKLDRTKVVDAFQKVRWPGRLDLIPGFDPPLLLDCAHNPMGVRALLQYLEDMEWPQVVVLFTAMKDKNFQEMLQLIRPVTKQMVLCRVEPFNRCASETELSDAAAQAGLSWIFESVSSVALDRALGFSKDANLPFVAFGSIYMIGELFSRLGIPT